MLVHPEEVEFFSDDTKEFVVRAEVLRHLCGYQRGAAPTGGAIGNGNNQGVKLFTH